MSLERDLVPDALALAGLVEEIKPEFDWLHQDRSPIRAGVFGHVLDCRGSDNEQRLDLFVSDAEGLRIASLNLAHVLALATIGAAEVVGRYHEACEHDAAETRDAYLKAVLGARQAEAPEAEHPDAALFDARMLDLEDLGAPSLAKELRELSVAGGLRKCVRRYVAHEPYGDGIMMVLKDLRDDMVVIDGEHDSGGFDADC